MTTVRILNEDQRDRGCELVKYEEFKKPTTTKGVKIKKKVLDEDRYVEQIDKIIERDFFPDLTKLKAQSEYQQAMQDNDIIKMKYLQHKYRIKSGLNRPETGMTFDSEPNTPATFETPVRDNQRESQRDNQRESQRESQRDSDKDNVREKGTKNEENEQNNSNNNKELTLDKFLNKYTSEDNASFEVIQEEERKKHTVKYPWLYQDEVKQNQLLCDSLTVPSIETQVSDEHKPVKSVTWGYSNLNSVMYNPEGAPLTSEEILKKTRQEEIVYENTRFRVMPFNQTLSRVAIAQAVQSQTRQKEGKIGVDGRELVSKDTPQVNGFKFVPMTPSPMPGVSQSPLMTWGEIEGTPFRLDTHDTPMTPFTSGTTQFQIPDLPERDKIGLTLADNIAKQHREKNKLTIQRIQSSLHSSSSNSHKTPLERLNTMSPAAQKLVTLKLGLHKNYDTSLLASYSPARRHGSTPSFTPKIAPDSRKDSTPIITENKKEKRQITPSLTDNLLKLPKRPKASDYF